MFILNFLNCGKREISGLLIFVLYWVIAVPNVENRLKSTTNPSHTTYTLRPLFSLLPFLVIYSHSLAVAKNYKPPPSIYPTLADLNSQDWVLRFFIIHLFDIRSSLPIYTRKFIKLLALISPHLSNKSQH